MIFTQTIVKDLEREETCPFRWKSQWIDKLPELALSNEFMLKGKYFEQLVLGASAHGNEPIIDLPRLLNGNKSLDQQRIERQAERVKAYLNGDNPYGLILDKSQIELRFSDEGGTIDFTFLEPDGGVILTDLKLTKDLTSTRSKYGYGNDWGEMDHLQLTHYAHLYEKEFKIKPKTALFVVDYSPEERVDFREIILSPSKFKERDERFTAAKEVVSLYEAHGWVKIPSEYECKNCPLQCESRFKKI